MILNLLSTRSKPLNEAHVEKGIKIRTRKYIIYKFHCFFGIIGFTTTHILDDSKYKA